MGDPSSTLHDDVAMCVGCGLCLPHCPTFRITGEESHSPRGRISLIRASIDDESTPHDSRAFLDTCVQCRGCEPACPSGVPYGRILEAVNRRDERAGRRRHRVLLPLLEILPRPVLLDIAGSFVQCIGTLPGVRRLLPKRLQMSGLSIPRGRRVRRSVETPDVWLFTGCVMNVWFRNVHRATIALIESTGAVVGTPQSGGDCCGALHMHTGFDRRTRDMALRVMRSMPGTAPIVVNAAGCGALLKEYGELLETNEARAFADRVMDVHEWIAATASILMASAQQHRESSSAPDPVIVQEPCHLRHVQRISVADVVETFVPVLRLDNDGLCCGAGGAYSALHPEMAVAIRDRTSAAIHRIDPTGRTAVITANPGCHLHLAAGGHEMRSSVEVIARALGLFLGQSDRVDSGG